MKTAFTKITLLLIFLTSASAISQNPARDLQDIVGERGSYAEMDLEKRGYVHIKTSKSRYDVYSNWWNPTKKKCVTYHLVNGNIQSVTDVPPFDCNQSSGAGYSSGASNNHSSQHHNNNSHYSNSDQDLAFERGHNDGLYNKAYHNIYSDQNLKEAYSNGYGSGVGQRSSNTAYHSGNGGYQTHVQVNDVVGLGYEAADQKMRSKGFIKVDEFKSDGRTHRTYYNKNTKQCIGVRSAHGKVGHVEKLSHCKKQ